MMRIFDRIFKKYKTNSAESLKMDQESQENKISSDYSYDRQSVTAKKINNTVIIQYIEDSSYTGPLIDQKISEQLDLLRKSRFFNEFDIFTGFSILARKVVEGELSFGSSSVKGHALAWCSRMLSLKQLDKAEEYLKLAKEFGSYPEIEIAEAFISSNRGDKRAALSILADVNSSQSRTAALMIVSNHEGPQTAINWLETAEISTGDLDSDGRYFLLSLYLQLEQWEKGLSFLHSLTDDDIRETPALNHIMALTYLISAVPHEFRSMVLIQVPFDAAGFPLSSDPTATRALKTAHSYFITASEVAAQLNCPNSATVSDEYALWLELRDNNDPGQGMKRLESKLRGSKPSLHLVQLGLQFGIKLDLEAVEREIERKIALNGGITHDAATARFALAFTNKNSEDIANYIALHTAELMTYFDEKSLQLLQIEMLSKAGATQRARECLDALLKRGLSDVEENRIRRIISEVEGTNPIETKREQFSKTGSLSDLIILVDELKINNEWNELRNYSEILFERTHSLQDAELFINALHKMNENGRIVEFLSANYAFVEQSKNLQMIYCISLYYEGDLLQARSELSKMSNEQDNPNYRALCINLAVAIGDWNSLSAFIANECIDKDKRSAEDLISSAQLAFQLGSPHARELLFFAASKGKEDARILATAYFLASSAGWEDDIEVYQWLSKSAELSGNSGPIQKLSLQDMLNLKPNWERQEIETWRLLNKGDIPMFLAAESLNKSLIHMMLFPAYANGLEKDPRKQGAVYAYSGNRQLSPLKVGGKIAMDATVLLTLSFLNLLDVSLNVFDIVYITHSTLIWLFEEKRKAAFHQPSRFIAAHKIQHLLASGIIEKLRTDTVPQSELSSQIGDELALLIAEAEKMNHDSGKQHIVVRSSPIHRIASLMEEEADLSMHAEIISSCQAVVDKLRMKGQITADEMKRAQAYLLIHEKPWPNQPEIADGAVLYLDDLTMSYFLNLGILVKLRTAGFRLIVSPKMVSETNEFISYEGISEKVNDAIERIRSTIYLGIQSGKIKIGKKHNFTEQGKQEQSISNHPTAELFALASDCEAVLVDDRCINQHTYIQNGAINIPVFSTLDLLNTLVHNGYITDEGQFEYRTMLRRAGYSFIPISMEELAYHLNASTISASSVIETAELKAIKESILHVRMRACLQLPKENHWLDMMQKTFVKVLHQIWRDSDDFTRIRAQSSWILKQIDIRGWAHTFEEKHGNYIVKIGQGVFILMLLSPPEGIMSRNREEYWSWINEVILAPIKQQNTALYLWLVDWYRKTLAEITDKNEMKEVSK